MLAAHNTTHPKVKAALASSSSGASESEDNTSESDVLLRGSFKTFGSNERDGVFNEVVAKGNVALAFGGTKATTEACCVAANRAKKRVFESCILILAFLLVSIESLESLRYHIDDHLCNEILQALELSVRRMKKIFFI